MICGSDMMCGGVRLVIVLFTVCCMGYYDFGFEVMLTSKGGSACVRCDVWCMAGMWMVFDA